MLQVWSPACSQAVDLVEHRSPALGLCTGAVEKLIRVCAHPHFQLSAPRPLIEVHTHPGFQLWAPSPLIWVCTNWASGVCWSCLSHIHSPVAEGVGTQEAMAAMESPLNSHLVPLFSLFLFEKFLLFKPPWSKQAPGLSHSPAWLSPKNPAADPAPGQGFSSPGPRGGPGDLIVLKYSSYHQIFQCPLSLVSDLHICWNTVGCSLCSSDQLGISLVLRESGLGSHLSHCHLPTPSNFEL